jgi:hypothetical protein
LVWVRIGNCRTQELLAAMERLWPRIEKQLKTAIGLSRCAEGVRSSRHFQARISWSTSPLTSVRRKSRPRYL